MTDLALATTVPHATPTEGSGLRSSHPPGLALVRVLGRGGCATVYEARHEEFGDVAVKIGDAVSSVDSAATLRTLREASIARRIEHPNVVQVLDSGCTEDGSPFVVMEKLDGVDLEALAIRRGPMALDVVGAIGLDVLSALAAVHAAGIVHRDLKPTNVMLAVDPATGGRSAKLIDFGVARDVTTTKLTQTGVVIGTPQYLSPEQARGDVCDPRVDLWAVGVLLYELIVGDSPFDTHAVHETIAAILFGPPIAILAARPELPVALADVIDRALERDPEARYESADAMHEALTSALERAGIVPSYASLESHPATATTPLEPATSAPAVRRGPSTPVVPRSGIRRVTAAGSPSRRRRAYEHRLVAAGLVAIACSMITGFAMGHGSGGTVHNLVVPMVLPMLGSAPSGAEDGPSSEPKKVDDAPSSRRAAARVHVELARDAYRHGRFESAYRDYLAATRIDRGYASAFRGLHDAAERTGRYDVARSAHRRYRSILRDGR